MDKISGIIPSSNRVTSVDLESASPVRPGTPGFGAPTGRSAAASQMQRSSAAMVNPTSIGVPRWKAKEDQHAEIVTRLSDGFFRKNQTTAPTEPVNGPNKDAVEGLIVMPFKYDASGKVELPMPDMVSIEDYEGLDTVV